MDLLDFGVQDSGPDGAPWALVLRGLPSVDPSEVALAWTLRGAPHAYRRCELAAVAAATAPLSEADAAKRILNAARPLKAAGIPALEALRVVANHLRDIVTAPTAKGEVSGCITQRLEEPYLKFCPPCGTTHVYEMPFRLAALQAGLELEPGTSPPVLRPLSEHPPLDATARFDVIRNYLRFFGPARVGDVAGFLDAPVKEVKAHWPDDSVRVEVVEDQATGRPQPRFMLARDIEAVTSARSDGTTRNLRLVGPYDPYLQLRDRELLVTDEARRKDLWRVIGRPGAIVADGEIIGTWRPRKLGRRLTVRIEPWVALPVGDREAIEDQARQFAAHRGLNLVEVTEQ
ncbi:MAG: crosslink repair DNA glycosylase YcaQ family protein, partial [Acidimicrobiales bacterium]